MRNHDYNPAEVEKKWQKNWNASNLYTVPEKPNGKKFYILDMFPYPSGEGLHVGHPKGYIATDVVARFKMLNGFSVLHPMGWDAFGLPAENYAIKNKVHPRMAVEKNVARYKQQLEKFGFTYDWNREIDTTDPNYYKWTQWIFLQMWEKGLAFQSNEPVNWCPSCKTVLANEDLEDGKCERCGSEITQRPLRQWVLKMTDYADRLLYDLDSDEIDWEEMIVEQQRNWIGRSEGVEIDFAIEDSDSLFKVYTTRVDTIFGCTYCVIAPEHKLIEELQGQIENYSEVMEYIALANKKTVLQRTELQKEKTGVELKGIKAINPFNNEEVRVFVGDYVLGSYGTGAVMAVPAHDERDYEFAKKYCLEIRKSIDVGGRDMEDGAITEDGIVIDSADYSGLTSSEARKRMADWLERNGKGGLKVNYKMRDWVFSRQRYWGEPIPLVHCEKCGIVGIPESQLPVVLPNVKSYEPTDTGESPLAAITDWVNTTCPTCGGPAKRETNTMPQWGGSCWYYLRYIDPKNENSLIDADKEKDWMNVDLYVGGAEHATRHLLYARFWHKFLFDIGVVTTKEPFHKLMHVGLIMAEDGRKMSKRWNNVVNPDDVISAYGADAMRTYEAFMGPFTQAIAWSTNGVIGVRRFLDRVWRLQYKIADIETDIKLNKLAHQTIKKVSSDIENFRFNTAVSTMMILMNELERQTTVSRELYKNLLLLLAPFAPHITDELWERLGNKESIFKSSWPEYSESIANQEDDLFAIVVQVNGKVRDQLEITAGTTKEDIERLALASEKIQKFISGQTIKKIVYVEKKLVSIVV
ncbi:MAG: leucine--tRNA ligase [bacterium]